MQSPKRDIVIRAMRPADAGIWEMLRQDLWPDGTEEHGLEIAMFFGGHHFHDLTAAFIAEDHEGAALGYAELAVRFDVEGLAGVRTGYVEGLYVVPEFRHSGVALELLRFSRHWAREQGCAAFVSDRAGRIVVDKTFRRVGGNES
jgi:aminoglycoside 6'-N-acetyltransferase I